jgi:glycosyltransferase involved in cell wall biosynthesis
MKKDLLFVMNKLVCGGAEKSLISLLETIDYSKFNVDLFLFSHEGLFLDKVPKEVRILPAPEKYRYFDMRLTSSLKELMIIGDIKTLLYRLYLGYYARTEKLGAVIEQKFWKYLSKSMDTIEKEYDIAIGFQEKNPIYFCVDNVKAKMKIGWIHTDYNKLGINMKYEKAYFEKLNYVITVSEDLVSILENNFPSLIGRFKYIHNIVSPRVIRKLAEESIPEEENNSVDLLSVGRLAKEKGLEITLNAVEILVKKGYNIRWFLIGEGNMREELEHEIKEKNLAGKVIFLGQKANPYPYIRKANIYIQTSRYEGRSISIDEAKILAKPILITNFDTASNHIVHNKNGIISKMDALSVANDLERLIIDSDLRKRLQQNLEKEALGTEQEVHKLYKLVK